MCLEKRGGTFLQTFPEDFQPIPLQTLDVMELNDVEVRDTLFQWQSQFDMEQGPLFNVAFLHGYKDGSARIWFALHHLIVDTVSWNIITSDLQALYHGTGLGMKSSSVQLWALALQQYAMPSSERAYWDACRKANMMTMKLLPERSGEMLQYHAALSYDETTALYQQCCPRLGIGMHEIILTAVGMALQKLTAGSSSMVTIEGHGREESLDPSLDVSQTVGWFTSMYPFEISQVHNLIQGAFDVKKRLSSVPNRGIGYGPGYGYIDNSLPPVSVNYLGRLEQSQRRPTSWYLASGENEVRPGLYTSIADKSRSSSLLDLTFAATNGRLSVEISSCWGSTTSNTLLGTIQQTLHDFINAALSHTPPPAISDAEPEFMPYFSFEDARRRGPPLFMLPPGEGGAESYFHNVVQGLPDQKLIVFNNHYRHSQSLSTFEELAEYYIAHMRKVQPKGPYNILGWSFGGILGLEISQRLANNGEEIGTLALIDPYFDIPAATREACQSDVPILDPIYHRYKPDPVAFQAVQRQTDNLILFKATKTDETYGTPGQRKLYEWYAKSPTNCLDKFVEKDIVKVVPLQGTHFTWFHGQEQVRGMCAMLAKSLGQRRLTNGHTLV
jgi:N-(5-amino-5-carboxypentanoyl)-L-cysteinyl-D-valine synthase